MTLMQEREELTTLLDDVAMLHEVPDTLPADDERARALASVADHRLASRTGDAAIYRRVHARPIRTNRPRLGQTGNLHDPKPETEAAARPRLSARRAPTHLGPPAGGPDPRPAGRGMQPAR